MKRLASLALVLFTRAYSQQICPPTPAWSLCEISVPSSDPTLLAEFRGPNHRTFLIASFPEAGARHLRIVPTEPGTWDYRLISADSSWNTKEGSFTATASDAPGYIEAANVHHFRYTGSKQPHLWIGNGITHAAATAGVANDAQILALHKAGKTIDLSLPPDADIPLLVARYGALNITWRAPAAAEMLKQLDRYKHPIEGVNYLIYHSEDGDVPAVEHQLYPLPLVNDFGSRLTDTEGFRHALWRTSLDGAYPDSPAPNATAAEQMRHWFTFMSGTRHWELEPFFDADGRRALALEGVEYIVYVEQPGTVNVTVEKHNYDVAWFNPLTGEAIEEKKNLKSETFTGNPPDASHDWVLHISREGHKAGMLKSYKFESREVLMQEVETAKVPFEIVEPSGDTISLKKPGAFSAKLTRETKAAKVIRFVWTAEVTAEGMHYSIVGTGREGQLQIPPGIAKRFPASLHLRLEGLNGVGKLYSIDRTYQLVP